MESRPAAGDLIASQSFAPVTRERLARYAEVSGDPNPIHLDDEAARGAGLPGVIVHGMLSAAMLAERAEHFVRQECGFGERARLVEFQTRFKAKVLPGDAIVIGGTVKEVSPSLVLELHAKNGKGEVTTMAVARYERDSNGH